MTVGIIGTGYVRKNLCRRWVSAGYGGRISNSRHPETLQIFTREPGMPAEAVTPDVAAGNDMVILAVRWQQTETALGDLRND